MPQTRRPRRRPTEPKPIPAGLWFTLISVLALPLWWFRLPCMPMPLLAALIAGLTAHYPTTARKTDEPDPRKLRAYRRWKDILAGLAPNRDWTRIHRTSYWLWATARATPSRCSLRPALTCSKSPSPWACALSTGRK